MVELGLDGVECLRLNRSLVPRPVGPAAARDSFAVLDDWLPPPRDLPTGLRGPGTTVVRRSAGLQVTQGMLWSVRCETLPMFHCAMRAPDDRVLPADAMGTTG